MEANAIARRRMRTQRLWGTAFADPVQAVAFLGAVQSQELPFARWALGQRSRAATAAGVEALLDSGAILRTHILRPTWHFVLPEDIGWMLELTAPAIRSRLAPYDPQLDLDERLYGRAGKAIARAIEDQGHLTRTELGEALGRAKIAASGQRLAHIVMRAEIDGIVCSGAARENKQTYALVSERAPNARRLGRDEALAELTRRYFTGHGPATDRDFRWWASLRAADVRAGLEMSGSALTSAVVEGRTYRFASGSVREPRTGRTAGPVVDLVQAYDETIVGYTDSRDLLWGDRPRTVGYVPYPHAVLVDGRLAGHWRHKPPRGEVVIETWTDAPPTPPERDGLERAAARYGRFLGLPVVVR